MKWEQYYQRNISFYATLFRGRKLEEVCSCLQPNIREIYSNEYYNGKWKFKNHSSTLYTFFYSLKFFFFLNNIFGSYFIQLVEYYVFLQRHVKSKGIN